MSLQGLQTPNSINLIAQLLASTGLNINSTAAGFMGSSTAEANYTKGTIGSNTVLNRLIDSINLAYGKIGTNATTQVSQAVYDSLISIGSSTIPALGNSKPATYTGTVSNSLSRYGFIRFPALQAYNEFVVNGGTYKDFCLSFITAISFRDSTNPTINSIANSANYLQGVYSNMNDLVTADITGVNISTLYWGQDLIETGRAIDLSNIDVFGLPSVLLKTLQRNNAISQALSYALIFSELTTTEVNNFINGGEISNAQEQKIYNAFTLITGNDLTDILIPLNVQTTGLRTLADLLNPIKLFPTSYASLTVPRYNTTTSAANSKIYYPIYSSGAINPNVRIFNYGDYLISILPDDVRVACGAFATAMMQIRNIKNVPIERFAQVVTNLETMDGLTGVNGANGSPVTSNITNALTYIAFGSGTNGTYLATDFFGAMTGLNYNYSRIQQLLIQLATSNLSTIYTNIFNKLSGAGPYNTDLTTYITQANTEITTIRNNNTAAATELNTLWSQIGTNLTKETASRAAALPSNATSTITSVLSFVDNINFYALDTAQYQSSAVLEAIANTTNLGGQSLIALMREIRNANRLGLCGLELDNNISNSQTVTPQTSIGNVTRVTGASNIPGSFAGSPETDLVPFNLDIFNMSTSVSVPTQTPSQALQEVIDCNCDCWDNL
jgi:hypothetical protein